MTGPDRGSGEHSQGPRDRRERLFERARGLPAEGRSAFLDEQCGDDAELRAELESLLSNATEAEEFMEVLGRVADQPTDEGDVIERLNRALEDRIQSSASWDAVEWRRSTWPATSVTSGM